MIRSWIAPLIVEAVVVACGGGAASMAPTAAVSEAPAVAPTRAASTQPSASGSAGTDQLKGSTIWRLDPDRLAP